MDGNQSKFDQDTQIQDHNTKIWKKVRSDREANSSNTKSVANWTVLQRMRQVFN